MNKVPMLMQRLKDNRSMAVIFLSHCLLNENTRYLGGACRGGCVKEVIEQCIAHDVGIVQMPCPEQYTWGGVTKRWLLLTYGSKGTLLYRLRRILLPLFLFYTRLIYRRLARQTARQINDYLANGFSVVAIAGIDGSPSCGVNKTLDFQRSFDLVANADIQSITVEQMNAIIRRCLADGKGMFTTMLQEELGKRHLNVPFLAHDLVAELDGKSSSLDSRYYPQHQN
jgi:predicted secreted protein